MALTVPHPTQQTIAIAKRIVIIKQFLLFRPDGSPGAVNQVQPGGLPGLIQPSQKVTPGP